MPTASLKLLVLKTRQVEQLRSFYHTLGIELGVTDRPLSSHHVLRPLDQGSVWV
jgi:hypothetical protein